MRKLYCLFERSGPKYRATPKVNPDNLWVTEEAGVYPTIKWDGT